MISNRIFQFNVTYQSYSVNNMVNIPSQNSIDRAISNLKMIISGKPWYGKSLSELLATHEVLPQKVCDLVAHMLVWRNYTLDKLKGGTSKVALHSPEDWPTERTYSKDECLNVFEESNKALIEALTDFDSSKLFDIVPEQKFHFRFLIEGIVQHDVYHLGQIALYLKG